VRLTKKKTHKNAENTDKSASSAFLYVILKGQYIIILYFYSNLAGD
jgi:hypothetical protein